jgi:hypothetical protein
MLAIDPAETGEARVLPAHVRGIGIGFDAKDHAPRLPIGTDLATAERPGGMGGVAESGNIDNSVTLPQPAAVDIGIGKRRITFSPTATRRIRF